MARKRPEVTPLLLAQTSLEISSPAVIINYFPSDSPKTPGLSQDESRVLPISHVQIGPNYPPIGPESPCAL